MKIKVLELSNGWYRVLGTSNVYTADRKKYEDEVIRVKDVDFFSPATAANLISSTSKRDLFEVLRMNETRDYSQEVFLTLPEFRSMIASHIDGYVKTSNEPLQWSIDGGILGWNCTFEVHRRVDSTIIETPFEEFKPSLELVASFEIKELEKNIFSHKADLDAYVHTEIAKITETLSKRLTND